MLTALEIIAIIDGILFALAIIAYTVWGPSQPSRSNYVSYNSMRRR